MHTKVREGAAAEINGQPMAPAREPAAVLKGKPPPRACPDDFDVIFVEHGRVECERWYRASRITINRWLKERGKKRLIKARAAFVAHQRSQGKWLTRSSRLVEHRDVRATVPQSQPVRDRRKVSFPLARHAAQFLRTIRNGGYIVSPTPQGDWWVGSKRLSAAQMVDLAKEKGFDPRSTALQVDGREEVNR
jgi:hypothetical protein